MSDDLGMAAATTVPGAVWARKLQRFADLSGEDRRLLSRLADRSRRVRARQDLAIEGDHVRHAFLVVAGCLGRCKLLASGGRQILAFQLAGDVSDLDDLMFERLDHSVTALVPSEVALVPRDELLGALRAAPALASALRCDMALERAITREWQVNVGRRTAHERLAHLIVEVLHRLKAMDATWDHHISLPLTQGDIADTTSLSLVHVNRILQEWRAAALIEIEDRRIHILDEAALADIAAFDPAYLSRISGRWNFP